VAVVAEMRDSLQKLIDGPLPEEVGQARARLRSAEALYRKVLAGPRPQEVAEARAAEEDARARLAQSERGLTREERAEAKARLDAAVSQENLATGDAERYRALYAEQAVTRQQYEQAQSSLRVAQANRRDLEEAWRRADAGTPKEELEQARQAYLQARAALDLVLAGSRPEDIADAAANRDQAAQALNQLLRGSRKEDIRAARDRLNQAQAQLDALLAGSRKEDIAQANASAAFASASARSSEANIADSVVRAPFDGVVDTVSIAVGDLVTPQTVLMQVDNPRDIWLRVYVPETRLASVNVGSEAVLRVDGVSSPVKGHVESAATHGEFTPANLQTPAERGKQVCSVRLRLDRYDLRVKAGMYATVETMGNWKP
jgi:multidrug resistance efflux pump